MPQVALLLAYKMRDYLNELRMIVEECDHPEQDGEHCVQCREKIRFIERVEDILKP